MPEARFLTELETMEKQIKPALLSMGAVPRGWYGLTDVMYGPTDYNDRFVRLRSIRSSRIQGTAVVMTHKATTWGLYAKTDTILIRKDFKDMTSADAYIRSAYSAALKREFAFSRDGMRYALGDLEIFAEDIMVPHIRWSIELEGPDDASIASYAHVLGLGAPIRDSVPTLVHKRMRSRTMAKVIRLFK